MTLKYRCRICGDINETNDSRRTICDKPECQAQKRYEPRTHKLYCETCGNEIPIGSGKMKYCTKKCRKLAEKKRGYYKKKIKVPKQKKEKTPKQKIVKPKLVLDRTNYPDCPKCHTNTNVVRCGSKRYTFDQIWKCKTCNERWYIPGIKSNRGIRMLETTVTKESVGVMG